MTSRARLLVVFAVAFVAGPAGAARPVQSPEDVLADVRVRTARWLDIAQAREDGFVQISAMEPRHGYHFLDARSPLLAGAIGATAGVDLARPPILLYVERDGAWQLAGVEYALPSKPTVSPIPGAEWHEHNASCHYHDFRELPGSRARDCPARHPMSGEPFVLWHPALVVAHVWAWYPNPAGPFARDNDYLAPYGGAADVPHHGRNPAEALYSTISHRTAGLVLLVLAAVVAWESARPRRFPWNAASAPLWVAFGVYLFCSADPEAWPWGPGRVVDVFRDALVLQHKTLALVPIVIGIATTLRALGALHSRARYVVPLLAIVGSLSLFVHFHDGRLHVDAIYVQHAVMGATGVAVGTVLLAAARDARARKWVRWAWPGFLALMAAALLFYTER